MPKFNERFCIGKITNSNGALALAEAVLSFAIRQYRNKGTNEIERRRQKTSFSMKKAQSSGFPSIRHAHVTWKSSDER